MVFFKRATLFVLVNMLIMVMLNLILMIFGLSPSQIDGYSGLMLFCAFWGMGGSFISLLLSKFMAKKMMGLVIVDQDARYQNIVQMVHRCSKSAGLTTMPEVAVYESGEVNAFATGPSRSNSLVAVSTGLLNRMGQEEVEGVIGHEISHIANGDMVTTTLLQGVMNAFILFFAHVLTMIIDQALRNNDDGEGEGLGFFARYMLISFFQAILTPLAYIVICAFSRWREYRADAGSAKIVGTYKMVNALKALKNNVASIQDDKEMAQVRSMQISNKSSWISLFSTHPELDDRIEALTKN